MEYFIKNTSKLLCDTVKHFTFVIWSNIRFLLVTDHIMSLVK